MQKFKNGIIMLTENEENNMKVGDVFEIYCGNSLISHNIVSKGSHAIESHHKDVLDTNYGTDCIIDGVRVDWTCNYTGKDFKVFENKYSKYTLHIGGYDLKFCIRKTNSTLYNQHKKFAKPVVVCGIDFAPGTSRNNYDVFLDDFKKHGEEIISNIIKVRNDYYDTKAIAY